MTKKYSTKRALIASVLVLALCFTSLIGTTFAWFTDSVTSSGNKIVSGSLKIDLEIMNKDTGAWSSIKTSQDPIFNYQNWEPGYIDAKVLKVDNEGTLALKWKAKFVSDTELGILADVIDVYVLPYGVLTAEDAATKVAYPDRDLEGYTKVGTLRQFVNTIEETTYGTLESLESAYLGIALKMQESAGNDYQEETLGAFDIQIVATQTSHENDSFGDDYDADVSYVTSAATIDAFFHAIEQGDDVLLTETLVIDTETLEYINEKYPVTVFALGDETQQINTNAFIDGDGITVYRTEAMLNKPMFKVATGYTLVLANITVDGGAKWSGEIDPVLLRGTTNSGLATSANIISIDAGAHVVLEEGAIIQNNDGANAISLTRSTNGSSLTIEGGEIINNCSAAGAIWGGGKITLNSGKINGNLATSIGGAIRMLDNNAGNTISFTMNGGEMNHNKSNGSGGAIWSGNNARYYLNGGEMAYNSAAEGGGAIWGGNQDIFYITGDFEMHHNVAGLLGNAIRLGHYRWQAVEFEMTGGHIYANDAESGGCAIYANNNPVFLKGGIIDDVISYNGNDYITIGNTEINGVLEFNHDGRGDYKILLEKEFAGFNFVVEVDDALFPQFMLDPADDYVYTEGDEDKLVCMNEGYSTYWDAEAKVFKLKAN